MQDMEKGRETEPKDTENNKGGAETTRGMKFFEGCFVINILV